MTIRLHALDLQWIGGPADDPKDHCAHGRVEFGMNSIEFVSPADGIWTVSATALTLLRTLERDHSREHPVAAAQLFPCCAFSVWPCDGEFDVLWVGCPSGIDLSVSRRDRRVVVRGESGREADSSLAEWTEAVVGFSDQVQAFYAASTPKGTPEDPEDRAGWARFWREWTARRRAHGR